MTKLSSWLDRFFWPLAAIFLLVSYGGAKLSERDALIQVEQTWTEASFANGLCAFSVPTDATVIAYYTCVEEELIRRRKAQGTQ